MTSRPPGPLIIDLEGNLDLTAADRARLQHPRVGGVILFSRNAADSSQLRNLTREIKGLRSPELLVTVDQEGGRVQRFRSGFTRLPPAAACGRLHDADPGAGRRLARAIGLVMAAELIECGIDLSFAPVLDVLRCDSRVIGDRAFHSDPDVVSQLASACVDGMREAGMGSVGKHFPGHGGVGADSHACLPRDERSLDELRECDLLPYISLCGRLSGVMLAHVLYGEIHAEIPSYSRFWIRDVLREQVGFRGTVFSDDLTMAGAGDGPLPGRCAAALEAGCDLLIICNDLHAVDALLNGAQTEWAAPEPDTITSLYARPGPADPAALESARIALGQVAAVT